MRVRLSSAAYDALQELAEGCARQRWEECAAAAMHEHRAMVTVGDALLAARVRLADGAGPMD